MAAALSLGPLLAAFPDARVVLTVRADPARWARSWRRAKCDATAGLAAIGWAGAALAEAAGWRRQGRREEVREEMLGRLWSTQNVADPSVSRLNPSVRNKQKAADPWVRLEKRDRC